MTVIEPEGYKARLAKKKEEALADTPEGFELLGWIFDEKLYHYPLQTEFAFPVYRKIEL